MSRKERRRLRKSEITSSATAPSSSPANQSPPTGHAKSEGKTRPSPTPSDLSDSEKAAQRALEKYKELYAYSTDVLLKEHERFNRADEKAAKFSSMFTFLFGGAAFFGKQVFDEFGWPDFPVGLPPEWPLFAAAILALLTSAVGWFLSSLTVRLKPIPARPLNDKVLAFFDDHDLITVYDGFARGNITAYAKVKEATDQKYNVLKYEHRLALFVLVLLGELTLMYCLYSWL